MKNTAQVPADANFLCVVSLPLNPAACSYVCVCVCVCQHSQQAHIIKWWWDGGHVQLGDGKQLFNFTLPLSPSLYQHSLYLPAPWQLPSKAKSVQTFCPLSLSPRWIIMTLSHGSLLGLSTRGDTQIVSTHTHTHTHTRTNTACSDPDHWAESTFQLFITTLQQHTGAVQQRDRVCVSHNNNSDEFLLLGSAFFC